MVVPSHVMRDVAASMEPFLRPDTLLVTASKGIENQTHLTMSGVIRNTLQNWPENQLAALSGPSFG